MIIRSGPPTNYGMEDSPRQLGTPRFPKISCTITKLTMVFVAHPASAGSSVAEHGLSEARLVFFVAFFLNSQKGSSLVKYQDRSADYPIDPPLSGAMVTLGLLQAS